ncbi:PLC-like phosphodiesterase [Phlegmacium glaucopus]|nr:PLC-like phosphodiesterase [Phlegmacium glaucopus]
MLLLGANRLLVLVSALFAHSHSVFGSVLAPAILPRATICNGHAELCNRSFGNVTFVGAHDSYAIGVNTLAANQDQNVTQQLNDGIRMLQMQAHDQNGIIQLCHTSCGLYNGGTLQDYLQTVKAWMDANPNEVLSLLIVNIDDLSPTRYDPIFRSVGLDTLSFAPTSSPIAAANWPTLGSMIDSGKRLVTFLDNAADLTSVPYLLDEFTNIWETAFNVIDTTFDCNVNRTKGDTSTQMYLINHFLDKLLLGQPVPNVGSLNQTNAVSGTGSLGDQTITCLNAHGLPPNFLLVDYYEFGGGSVFQVAATINAVSYNPATPIATPASTSTSIAGASASVDSKSLSGSLVTHLDRNQRYAYVVSAITVVIGMLLVL